MRSTTAEPGLPPHQQQPHHDLTEFKASIIATRSAFPDLVTVVDEIVVEDRAAIRWHSSRDSPASLPRRAGHQASGRRQRRHVLTLRG